MQLKHVDKVLKIVDKIKKLDKGIIQLEALAMQAANGESEVSVKFDVVDLVKKGEDKSPVTDEDGSLILNITRQSIYEAFMPRFSFGSCDGRTATKDESKTSFKEDNLKDVVAMQLFGLLLHYKQAEREKLIKSLNRYGVKQ